MNGEEALCAYEKMLLIRVMEERISALYKGDIIPGFVHTSIGQEACAVGALTHARVSDVITSTHRGHGHVLAKGLEPDRMMAELMGKVTGANNGRGGSMHVADPRLGIFGANGIVGAGLPIALGAAFAAKDRGEGDLVVAFFGDGAIATGAFHEAMNMAALWKLPVIFLCENNGFSEFSSTADQHPVPISARAAGYGMESITLAGNDVEAVADGIRPVYAQVRGGSGPVFVEVTTLRVHGHYEGDPQVYRDKDEMARDILAADPLTVTRGRLRERGIGDDVLDLVDKRVRAVVDEAERFARASPQPEASSVMEYIYSPRRVYPPGHLDVSVDAGGAAVSQSKIIKAALDDSLGADPDVFLAGIDVAGGNVFGLTRGLAAKYPGRVFDTPISESAIMGLAVGSAMAGRRPVVELMYLDFLGVCLDQLMNQAAKLRFMTGGAASLPLVVRTQFGSGRSSGGQHSQSLEALLAHIPGLTVLMPSSGADAYGLLRAAIEDDNPVMFIEHRLLYEKKSLLPSKDFRVPIGKAAVTRPGSDVTIVSWSRMAMHALIAAESLADEGIDAEVIDLRTIAPLDRETILESFGRTNRMVIAQEAVVDFGVGAEIAALAVDSGFYSLDAPVVRVGARYAPAPYAPVLEREWEVGPDDIVAAVRRVMSC
ncbi:dehydrogenase E1 component subunit alpha/beta [Rhodococcus erythropolis]|uniref:alpha-ketoacid dehydrogenase subunit alpha/beta n=1 Tax=Rhodococcus sp. TaxID=1831 RepID=UPI001A34DC7B|nr:dehydrogenase E1 component subunit alpha/beta [Rhodococcus sp. (in: high G+C Gram-positive bacteria)]MBJ7480168.1 dehydrogenase E1 component subunit alpha/beta [Rhodococcus sp. (in: high G+C Gram-positive bacteria)]